MKESGVYVMEKEKIIGLLEERKFKELKEKLENMHPVDIVDILDEPEIDKKQMVLLFRLLSKEEAADVFTDMNSDMREYLINALKETGKDNIRIYDSVANYILFYTEAPLYDRLLKEGILIRDCSNYRGLGKGYYRIAVKDHASNERLMERLRNERT